MPYDDRNTPFSYDDSQNVGLGISLDAGSYTEMKREHYGSAADDASLYEYGTPVRSPTPLDMRTRSGQIINRPIQNLRPARQQTPEYRGGSPAKTPKKRVKKEKVKAESKMAKLHKPLSELTAAWTHVPVVDIDAYVNRSAEERRREVETGKQPGKVKRPMNSFMLYRKAYQNRTKNWCLQNNHQVVSQVCGESWPLEPEQIRAQFNEWARIERQNHQNAHPGYKFSPTKAGAAKQNKRKAEESDEESVLSDYDWEGNRPAKRSRMTPRRTPGPAPFTANPYYTDSQPDSRGGSMEPGMGGGYHPGYMSSAYSTHNPGKPPPMQYDPREAHQGQYWQQQVRTNGRNPNVEDIIMRKAHAAGGEQLYAEYPDDGLTNSYYGVPEVKIDPSLGVNSQHAYNFDPNNPVFHDGLQGFDDPTHWNALGQPLQDEYKEYLFDQNASGLHLAQNLNIPNNDSWQVESLETGDEFGKWDHEQ